MGYREDWFRRHSNPMGMYQCRNCHGWFRKEEIDIDHIIPRHCGGTDADYNLQPLCAHCNRSKQADMTNTGKDLVVNAGVNLVEGAIKGVLGVQTPKKRASKKKASNNGGFGSFFGF